MIDEPVINGPILNEQVNNGPIATHEKKVQEGNNDFESNQGPPLQMNKNSKITMVSEVFANTRTL